jgi:hypothetical protein
MNSLKNIISVVLSAELLTVMVAFSALSGIACRPSSPISGDQISTEKWVLSEDMAIPSNEDVINSEQKAIAVAKRVTKELWFESVKIFSEVFMTNSHWIVGFQVLPSKSTLHGFFEMSTNGQIRFSPGE